MPLTTQDLVHGVDMTGIASPTASDFNNLIDQSNPQDDGGGKGKGIVLATVDVSDGVPDVPDASVTVKWKRYVWMRLPFSITSSFITPKLYAWTDLTPSDVTFLKWLPFEGDIEAIQNEINVITANLATTSALANNAYNLASSVSSVASDALAAANAANATANDADTTASDAQTTAQNTAAQLTTVQTGITNATNTANSALTAANDANTTATAFVASHNTALVAQTAAQNNDLGVLAAGENNVLFNTIVYGGNNMVLLTAGKIQFNNAGTYIIDAVIQAYIFNDRIQAKLFKDSDSSQHGFGTVATELAAVNSTHYSHIRAQITVAANDIYRISLFALSGNGTLGQASNLGPEYYNSVRIEQIA
jgi:hypothetical protein